MIKVKTEHMPTLRVVHILELLAEHSEGLTLTEIAKGIDSSKGTISPILSTLRASKFIFYNQETSRYTIGLGSFSVGVSYISNMNTMQFIRSEMRYVVRQSGETCQFGVLEHDKVLYLAIEESLQPIRICSRVGKRMPLYCTGLGKSLISDMSIDQIKALHPDGLVAFTEKTVTSFDVLERQLETFRQNDYVALERGEVNEDLTCVSVPLFAGDEIFGAVSVSISTLRATEEKLEQARQLLIDMRRKVKEYAEIHPIEVSSFLDGC